MPLNHNSSQIVCFCFNVLMATGSCAYQRKVLLLTTNKTVKETVMPCLSYPLGIELVLDAEIFTDTTLLLTSS